ncbi:MFS transporter [Halobacillus salinarum]|uniref:MFS transporter n=1 Tax=Halobacillus salinarum TaxID=2932257 RepID=A0ABY4EFL8_9BACI|nr:MFS transporter [Halobacillus salinarum]UOQ43270.1 MFS transporter [Halobacillus salinarum]
MLLKHPYKHLFFSGIVNGVGDRFSQVAVLTLLLDLTGSGLAVGTAMGIRILPYLLLSPAVGRLSDAVNPRFLLIGTDLVRVPFAFIFLLVHSKEDLWIVYAGLIVLSCGEAFYQPVRKSSIAKITEKNRLMKVNGLEQVVLGIVLIAGSITGGLVTYWIGIDMAFLLNGFSFIAAGWLIKGLPNFMSESKGASNDHSPKTRVHLKRLPPVVLLVIIVELVTSAQDGVFNTLISYYGSQSFNLGGLGIGLLYGALGFGLVGSFFVTRVLARNYLMIGLTAMTLEGLLQIGASQADTILGAALLFSSISFVGGIGASSFHAILMTHIKEGWQGRVYGWIESWTNVILGLVMLVSGIAVDLYSANKVGFAGGSLGAVTGLIISALLAVITFQSKRRN